MTPQDDALHLTAFDLAQRFAGLKEVAGPTSHPQILAMLQLDASWPGDDEVPWCSAFCNYIAWLLRLPRSKSLRARSWLGVGTVVDVECARPRFDVVILRRGADRSGPDVLDAPGHVGFFAGYDPQAQRVLVLGGNQANQVSVAPFRAVQVLGVRRLRG